MERAISNITFFVGQNATSARLAALQAARDEFPGCVTTEELSKLAEVGLIDCQDAYGNACERSDVLSSLSVNVKSLLSFSFVLSCVCLFQ
eukprot:3422823-Rhodomonas_salina.2